MVCACRGLQIKYTSYATLYTEFLRFKGGAELRFNPSTGSQLHDGHTVLQARTGRFSSVSASQTYGDLGQTTALVGLHIQSTAALQTGRAPLETQRAVTTRWRHTEANDEAVVTARKSAYSKKYEAAPPSPWCLHYGHRMSRNLVQSVSRSKSKHNIPTSGRFYLFLRVKVVTKYANALKK